MTDIIQEYATDPVTGQTIAIDPPLQQSETPLTGNPVLMRREAPRRGRSNTALYAGATVALVAILAGGAYLVASGVQQRNDLTTTSVQSAPPAEQAAATPTAAPTPSPVVASAQTPEQPLRPARAERAEAVRHVEHRAAARAAGDNAADASATVASSQFAPPPAVATPAPATATPAATTPAPSPVAPAPVITPPPAAAP